MNAHSSAGRRPMIKINAAWLVSIVESIDAVDHLTPGQTVMDAFGVLFAAQSALEQVFDQSFYRDHVRASRTTGKTLHDQIARFINDENWAEKKFEQYEIALLKNAKSTFKTVFMADLGVMPIYIVAKKDTFDVSLLGSGSV